MPNTDSLMCAACGSKDLCFGHVGTPGNVFVPTGLFTVYGFKIRAYVCLDCGYIGQFLPKDKIGRLKGRFGDDASG